MRRLVSVCLLVLCLSLPVFAGHMVIGGGWCPDGSPGCAPDGNGMVLAEPSQEAPADLGSETLFVLAALILMLRYKV